ncbi:MAG: hypothetical protein ACQXXJ_09190 [Candidatus Bathyarchaeia archaeon]|nr:hypothetical protein [Candidatus Bathyarchaeota archaeon]
MSSVAKTCFLLWLEVFAISALIFFPTLYMAVTNVNGVFIWLYIIATAATLVAAIYLTAKSSEGNREAVPTLTTFKMSELELAVASYIETVRKQQNRNI